MSITHHGFTGFTESGIARRSLIARSSCEYDTPSRVKSAIDVERIEALLEKVKTSVLTSDLSAKADPIDKYGHDLKRLPPNPEGIFIHEIFEHQCQWTIFIHESTKFRIGEGIALTY